MSKLFATAFVLALFLATFTQAATYCGGSGTELDPYQIWTAEQMKTIGSEPTDWGKHFKLMTNIDMSVYTNMQYYTIGNSSSEFRGTFDGNGYTKCASK